MARFARRFLAASLAFSPLVGAAGCHALRPEPADCADPSGCDPAFAALGEPAVCHDQTMHALACDLDHLEKHIDWYGSVVAKAPDVWGAARLTSYRQETETQMRVELNKFTPTIAGGLARVDTADLLLSLTVNGLGGGVAAGGGSAGGGDGGAGGAAATAEGVAGRLFGRRPPAVQVAVTSNPVITSSPTTTVSPTNTASPANTASPTNTNANTNTNSQILAAAAASGSAASAAAVAATEAIPGVSAFDTALDRSVIGLEPTTILAQKLDYLNTLNQYRRGVEGDDTSDAPGYSMNLVRIPVSLLPGKRTDTGHGAEITFTVNPVLDPELLPRTTRDLIVNDVVALFALPMTKALERANVAEYLANQTFRQFLHLELGRLKPAASAPVIQAARQVPAPPAAPLKNAALRDKLQMFARPGDLPVPGSTASPDQYYVPARKGRPGRAAPTPALADRLVAFSNTDLAANFKSVAAVTSYGPDLKGTRAMPATVAAEVYGPGYIYEIALLVSRATESTRAERGGRADMPEVEAVLKEHLLAAHRFLERPENAHLWPTFCNPAMVEAVRSGKLKELTRLRAQFRRAVQEVSDSPLDVLALDNPDELNRLVQFSAVSALAWGILVDAALLNERLIEDVRRTASAKGLFLCPDGWPTFVYPDPPAEARALFAEYVKARWPIHVFAIDPASAEQNVSDELIVKRNTQLALTLGFLRGAVSAEGLVKATRNLEAEYDTIALNRTQVGFAHGGNVFGWRFYPRFQTPDTQSNAVVFLRDNLIGGPNRNALLRQRRLEPGPRECTALVLMPSFVPYATLDSVGNWFSLAHPKHKVLDHTQALKLSRTVQAIRTDGCGVTDAHKYRDGDLRLLQARAEQLSARLPFQAAGFQVPVLNTLSGFELFGNATTNLAPELAGWYGSPGATAGDRLFLVGDHFSVNNTSVVIGNRPARIVKMLSRQVMEVEVPDTLTTIAGDDGDHVHVVVATPYGVSRELELPVFGTKAPEPAKPAAAYKLSAETLGVTYYLKKLGDQKFAIHFKGTDAKGPIYVEWADPSGSVPKSIAVEFTFDIDGVERTFPATKAVFPATPKGFAIPEAALKVLAAEVVAAIDNGPYTLDTDPLRGLTLKAKRVRVTPDDATHDTKAVDAANLLELRFTPEIVEK